MPSFRYSLTTILTAGMLAANAQAAEKITLHALMEDVPETTIIEAMLPDFEKQTGIHVEFQKLVYSDMHDKLVAQLTAPASDYNVLEVDFLWAGEFPAAGWLQPLEPFVKASGFDLSPFLPAMLDLVGRSGQTLYMIPMYNYSMGLIYRTDLLADSRLGGSVHFDPGGSLRDYVEASKQIKAKLGIAGAAMQGQRGDPNSMEFSNYLFSSGGRYLDEHGAVALDSPQARQALALYVDNINNGAQQGALSATLDDTMRLMCDGHAWSMVTYWWMLPQLDDQAKCPAVAGKLALSVMPGGHGESGGWGWAIPRNESAELQEAAWTFIAWVQSAKVTEMRALQGHAPVRSDVFESAPVLAKFPFYKAAEPVVASGQAFPVFAYSAQYEDVLGAQLSLAASGKTSVDAAIAEAASGLSGLRAKAQ